MTTSPTIDKNLHFVPINVPQGQFVDTEAPNALFSGAFGGGKTVALCTKALKLSMDYPNNFGLLCRKTRSSMTHTTLKTFFEICPPDFIANYNKTEGLVQFTNGSGIIFGGLDDPLKLGSLNLGWCGIDEALETNEEDWLMLDGRLRKPGVLHQAFAACNPGAPAHYLHRKFWGEGGEDHEVYQVSSFDNPKLPKDYLERLGTYTGVYYERNVLGRWTSFEGLVYSSFDEAQIIPRFKIPDNWLIYTGHDFGGSNPAAMFYARDPATGDFFAHHEYLPGAGRSIYEHVTEFKRITEGANVIRRAGGSHQEGEIRQGYTAQGWPISEPKYARRVAFGIQRVFDMHTLNKIYVFDDLTNYLREKLSYAYEKKDGVQLDTIEHKNRFHLMDAERSILPDFAPEMANAGNVAVLQDFRKPMRRTM